MSGAGPLRKTGSVIWAVDPLEGGATPAPSAVMEMLECARRAGLRLIPAYVLSLSEKQLASGELQALPEFEARLARYLRQYSMGPEGESAVVLTDQSSSRMGAVQVLLELADRENAAWIVVSSHGRAGMKRLMLGSFAEILLRESRCPALFLPRRPRLPAAMEKRRVLFPTDFSAMAGEAFTEFLQLAACQRFEIVLYHLLTFPVASIDIGMAPSIPDSFMTEHQEWSRREGERWVAKAAKAGVKASFVMESDDLPAITGTAVLAAAKKEEARMIAMPSLSSPLNRLVAGSVAHEVFRAGSYPVWLYGPRALREKRGRAA